ncbi:MAG TPA: GYD domain-containing protein [Chloroflexota bacterium]|nr:GYD domain-containing protein [Chloroflexota bacterium]
MPTYIVLGNYTEQGIRNIKNLAKLRQSAEQWASSKGGRIVSNYTTFGPYDFVVTVEMPSDEVCLEGAFTFGSQGDVRTVTMRAFTPQEAESVAQRIP